MQVIRPNWAETIQSGPKIIMIINAKSKDWRSSKCILFKWHGERIMMATMCDSLTGSVMMVMDRFSDEHLSTLLLIRGLY